jgi:hypothetical protein
MQPFPMPAADDRLAFPGTLFDYMPGWAICFQETGWDLQDLSEQFLKDRAISLTLERTF